MSANRSAATRANTESRPMRHLYFMHANKTYSLVEKDIGEYDDSYIFALIGRDVRRKNPKFAFYQKDCWSDSSNRRWYDVGSPCELYVVF